MSRRERLEARLAKRESWSESRKAKARAAFDRSRKMLEGIPLGQPILVGHHSEKRHRRTLEKSDNAMRAACESDAMASHHASKAAGLARQLETSIYSDDEDAPERLAERIAELEAKRASKRAIGAAWRKAKRPKSTDAEGWARVASILGLDPSDEVIRRAIRDCASEEGFCNRGPVPDYVLSNLGGNVSRLKKRLEEVERRRKREAETEAAGGLRIARSTLADFCNVQFSKKPERSIIDALKANGFHWGGGMWNGITSKIPAEVLELEGEMQSHAS